MDKRISILSAVLTIGCFGACSDPPPGAEVRNRIFVQNNNNEAIAFMLSYIYPDTIIPDAYSEIHGVPANYFVPFDSEMEWKDLFESLPKDTLSIFIFDGDTLAVNSFPKIRTDYNILKRYDLSYQDFERLKLTIAYPPESNMQGIKMYPN